MLAVDEISMVPGYIFDDLNQILKVIRNNDKPFGGLQLILFGDFFQLPPVSMNADNELDFCFMSQAWQEAELRICDMKQVFRQHDAAFIDMLNRIRVGEPSALDTDMLLSRMITPEYQIDRPKPTFLATHHHYARSINETELSKLGGKIREYVMQDSGDKTSCEFLRKNCLASEILLLKEGTQVMMLKNTYHKDGIINGSTGIIDSFDASTNYPIVKFHNGKRMVIGPAEWAIEDLDPVTMKRRVKGAVKQVPLQLAWAITIHKSQGMTINKIECIMSNAFVEGQIYVALSRVRNLEDIFMHSFDASKIRAHPQVREFYKNRESVGVE
jgi:ATP-dependent DNA helicase PIF1